MIASKDCKNGYVYEVDARNFSYGVYSSEESGFIGIRHKFADEFLDIEVHWDVGPPYGTAKPLRELGKVPDNIRCQTSLGLVCEETGKPISWYDGRYVYLFEGAEASTPEKGKTIMAVRLGNKPLEDWLKKTGGEEGWK